MAHTLLPPAGRTVPLPFNRLYEASGDGGYLKDAETFYDRSRSSERFTNPNPDRFSYENVIPALHLLLYKVRTRTLTHTRVFECIETSGKGRRGPA